MREMFYAAKSSAEYGLLVFSVLTDLSYAFYNARNANPDTAQWDTSNVETMESLFEVR